MRSKQFLMGNEVLARAARAAGALGLYGYPITPGSEILLWWAKEAGSERGKKDGLVFVQAEDEIGASVMLLGAVMAGYQAKMMGEVELYEPHERGIALVETEKYLLEDFRKRPINEVVPTPEVHIRVEDGVEYSCYRNCLDLEEDTLRVNLEIKGAWD